MPPRRGSSGSVQLRSLDPYQSTRPFNVEREPFDFASEGRSVEELLRAGKENQARRWEAPNFSFRESPEFKLPIDPITQQVNQFKTGAAEDDVLFDLLGSSSEAIEKTNSWNPLDYASETLKNYGGKLKERGVARSLGSIIPAALEEVKGPLTALKGAAGAAAIIPPDQARKVMAKLGLTSVGDPELSKLIKLAEHHHSPDTAGLENFTKLLQAGNPEMIRKAGGGHRGGVPQLGFRDLDEILDLSAGGSGGYTAAQADELNDFLAGRLGELPPPRQTPRGTGQTNAGPIVRPGLPTIYDVTGSPVTSLGRGRVEGVSSKRILEGEDMRRWMQKGSTWESGTDFYDAMRKADKNELAQEHAGSLVSNLLTGKTPRAVEVAEGGTLQPWLDLNLKEWDSVSQAERQRLAPVLAPQVQRAQVADAISQTSDLHGKQFLVDQDTSDLYPMDKAVGDIGYFERSGGRGIHIPYDYIYGNLNRGPQGIFAPHADPNVYQETANKAANWSEQQAREILGPKMRNRGMNSTEQDAYVRKFLQNLQNLPRQFEDYYRASVKP
jgi:hypothetical protein